MPKLPLTEPEIGRFAECLGRMLLRLPVVSSVAGHACGKATVKDYLRAQSIETEFLLDIFSRSTPEVLVKWYPRLSDGAFSWPDATCNGSPSQDELDKAKHTLLRDGMQVANYTTEELAPLTHAEGMQGFKAEDK